MSDTDLDPDAPPSAEELALGESLRAALDDPEKSSDDAALLRALSLAETPRALDEQAQARLVEAALERFDRKQQHRRGVVIRVAFGATALVAAAAAVLLLVARPPAVDTSALAHARSTQPLFDQPFERGQASARADRIATARGADYRNNRFSQWGVR
ncbi:hypothetical protein BH09MYX1_BH09MYX1_37180 [soil metagenome]